MPPPTQTFKLFSGRALVAKCEHDGLDPALPDQLMEEAIERGLTKRHATSGCLLYAIDLRRLQPATEDVGRSVRQRRSLASPTIPRTPPRHIE
eukprot:14398235-Alexandrium_andersonii.AAC.1